MRLNRVPLLKRLIPSVGKRIVPLIWPRGWRVAEFHGALFLVNYFSFLDRRVGFDRDWELEQIAYFLENLEERKSEIFLDIGACGGLYAILIAKAGCCNRIIAFDPDQRCRERLFANLHLNGLSGRVEVRLEAVSDRNGTLSFFCETPFAIGKSHVVIGGGGDCTVPCVRLDDDLGELRGKRIAIKVDVEGHELETLAGMKSLLTSNRCFLQVESFDDHVAAVRRQLADLGYRLIREIGPDRYFSN